MKSALSQRPISEGVYHIVASVVLFFVAILYDLAFYHQIHPGFATYGLYLSDGTGVITDSLAVAKGAIPGVDFVTFWGLWQYLYNALFIKLFGPWATSVKLATAFFDGFQLVVFYFLGLFFLNRRTSFIFAFLFILFNQHFNRWNHGYISFSTNTLIWTSFVLFLSAMLRFSKNKRFWGILGVGLIIGFAYGWKFSYTIAGGLGILAIMLFNQDLDEKKRILVFCLFSLFCVSSYSYIGVPLVWSFCLLIITILIIFNFLMKRKLIKSGQTNSTRDLLWYGIGGLLGLVPMGVYYLWQSDLATAWNRINPFYITEATQHVSGVYWDVRLSSMSIIREWLGLSKQSYLVLPVCLTFLGCYHYLSKKKLERIWVLLGVFLSFGVMAQMIDFGFILPRPIFLIGFTLFALDAFILRSHLWEIQEKWLLIFISFLFFNNYPGANFYTFAWGVFPGFVLLLFKGLQQYWQKGKLNLRTGTSFILGLMLLQFIGARLRIEWREIRHANSVYSSLGTRFEVMPNPFDLITEKKFANELRRLQVYVKENVPVGEVVVNLTGFAFLYAITDRLPPPLPWHVVRKGDLPIGALEKVIEFIKDKDVKWVFTFHHKADREFGSWPLLQNYSPESTRYIDENFESVAQFAEFQLRKRKMAIGSSKEK